MYYHDCLSIKYILDNFKNFKIKEKNHHTLKQLPIKNYYCFSNSVNKDSWKIDFFDSNNNNYCCIREETRNFLEFQKEKIMIYSSNEESIAELQIFSKIVPHYNLLDLKLSDLKGNFTVTKTALKQLIDVLLNSFNNDSYDMGTNGTEEFESLNFDIQFPKSEYFDSRGYRLPEIVSLEKAFQNRNFNNLGCSLTTINLNSYEIKLKNRSLDFNMIGGEKTNVHIDGEILFFSDNLSLNYNNFEKQYLYIFQNKTIFKVDISNQLMEVLKKMYLFSKSDKRIILELSEK